MAEAAAAKELEDWRSLAVAAARQAGEFLLRVAPSEVKVTAAWGKDIKLAVDQEAEARIAAALERRSGIGMVSEESGTLRTADARGLRWIVDPLDGSFNYLRGIPFCCVSIALWRENEPLVGVVYDFNRGELFSGIVGTGAWINETAICPATTERPLDAVLCTGFPVSTDFSSQGVRQFIEQVQQYKKIRLLGSAALMLCYVAAGRVDAYYERDIRLWDVAAGIAIVQAAGGVVVRTDSRADHTTTVYAGNAFLPGPVR